jgi:hypothetical protein
MKPKSPYRQGKIRSCMNFVIKAYKELKEESDAAV